MNAKLSIYYSPFQNPLAQKPGTSTPMGPLVNIHLPYVCTDKKGPKQSVNIRKLSLILVAPLWPHREWLSALLSLHVEEPCHVPMIWNLLSQPHVKMFHQGLGILNFTSGMYAVFHQKAWLIRCCKNGCNSLSDIPQSAWWSTYRHR